jgi:hypothetical protein
MGYNEGVDQDERSHHSPLSNTPSEVASDPRVFIVVDDRPARSRETGLLEVRRMLRRWPKDLNDPLLRLLKGSLALLLFFLLINGNRFAFVLLSVVTVGLLMALAYKMRVMRIGEENMRYVLEQAKEQAKYLQEISAMAQNKRPVRPASSFLQIATKPVIYAPIFMPVVIGREGKKALAYLSAEDGRVELMVYLLDVGALMPIHPDQVFEVFFRRPGETNGSGETTPAGHIRTITEGVVDTGGDVVRAEVESWKEGKEEKKSSKKEARPKAA